MVGLKERKEREREEARRKRDAERKEEIETEELSEVSLTDEEIVKSLDLSVAVATIVGQYKDKDFAVRVKLLEKKRRKWLLEELGEGIGLSCLPSNDHKLVVQAILNQEGLRVSKSPLEREREEKKKEEEEKKRVKPVLESEDWEEIYRDKIGPAEAQTSGFWNRQGLAPSLPDVQAGGWVKQLKKAQRRSDEDLSPMVQLGLAKRTRQVHQKHLRDLEYLRPEEGESLVSGLLRFFETEHKWRGWEGSTLCSNMASTQGALANLPLYRRGMAPVLLKISPEWRMGLKGAGNMGRGKAGRAKNTPKIATLGDIKKAMQLEKNPVTRAAIEIGWVTASRGGCIIHLRTGNVQLDDTVSSVRFVEGKTASHRPYTVHTTPVSWETQDYVERRVKEVGEGSWLFPGLRGVHIKNCLRRANPRLEQRSLRRGSIQHLAEGGMKDADLLHITQHRIMDTLNRYLESGWLTGERKTRAASAKGLSLVGTDGKIAKEREETEEETEKETEEETEEEEDMWEFLNS